MRYSNGQSHLHVEINTKDCDIPSDERARMQTLLTPLRAAVMDFPASTLWIHVLYHPRSETYHVELKLLLPGQTLITGERDGYLDSAFGRCVSKLLRKVEASRAHPNQEAVQAAEQRLALDREVVAPADRDTGPLAKAVAAGNYRSFRTALAGYEEWLRKRIGRWVQRYPEAEARIGKDLLLGDLVEEVYLNAFEQFPRRPADVPLSDWLNRLIDPSLKAMLRHPDTERENASLARTVREASLE